jgi:hypothetical protein
MRAFAKLRCVFGVTLIMAGGGCDYVAVSYTPIVQITANPARYDGREVRIAGTVIDVLKMPFFDMRIYVLQDDSGRIPVVTRDLVPGIKERVALKGVVESAAIIGTTSVGLHVTELKRFPDS